MVFVGRQKIRESHALIPELWSTFKCHWEWRIETNRELETEPKAPLGNRRSLTAFPTGENYARETLHENPPSTRIQPTPTYRHWLLRERSVVLICWESECVWCVKRRAYGLYIHASWLPQTVNSLFLMYRWEPIWPRRVEDFKERPFPLFAKAFCRAFKRRTERVTLSISESVKFSLIEPVICIFIDSSVNKIFFTDCIREKYVSLLNQLISIEYFSEIWLIRSKFFLAIWISQISLIIGRFWLIQIWRAPNLHFLGSVDFQSSWDLNDSSDPEKSII